MKKVKTNIEIYEEVAKEIGLKTEYIQSSPHRKPLMISNDKRFMLVNIGTPGFYPETTRWNACFTGSKLLTQKILKRIGYNVISSEGVRVTDFPSAKVLCDSLLKKEYNFPLLMKPDKGYDGKNINIVENAKQLTQTTREHFEHKSDFLIQPILDQNEYRVLVVNNEVVLMHSKHNQRVVGDGISTIEKLLSLVPASKKDEAFIAWQYKKYKTTPTHVLAKDQVFEYHLTKIPSTVYYKTSNFHPVVKKWALKLAKDINSPVIGIDVFIPDSFEDISTYTIIELNSNPAIYYLPTRCNDTLTGPKIVKKVLTDYFKIAK